MILGRLLQHQRALVFYTLRQNFFNHPRQRAILRRGLRRQLAFNIFGNVSTYEFAFSASHLDWTINRCFTPVNVFSQKNVKKFYLFLFRVYNTIKKVMPNQRHKDKRFVGAWLKKPLYRDVQKTAKNLDLSVSEWVTEQLTAAANSTSPESHDP